MKYPLAVFILGLVGGLLAMAATALASGDAVPPRRGGPCQYESLAGKARIFSVEPSKAAGESGRFLVKFLFEPQAGIKRPLLDPDKIHTLLDDDLKRPDADFLRLRGIRPGAQTDCLARVLVRGTCSPVLFSFPLPHAPDAVSP